MDDLRPPPRPENPLNDCDDFHFLLYSGHLYFSFLTSNNHFKLSATWSLPSAVLLYVLPNAAEPATYKVQYSSVNIGSIDGCHIFIIIIFYNIYN